MSEAGAMRIAIDAMGGDHAPQEVVKGALLALERDPALHVLLVGDESKITAVLSEVGGEGGDKQGGDKQGGDDQGGDNRDRVSIRNATEVIEMGESPVEALRRKHDTSIQRCIEAIRAQEVDAVLSAGDTGGVVAAAALFSRRLKGVKRHGIAIPVPTTTGRALLIDVGANIHCKPIHLLQYAIMASSYAQQVMGIENPRVGVLSIGEEAAKGNDLVKRTSNLLSRAELNFVGNVEGQAMFHGVADVIVCDGFVGNVILKVAEGLAEAILTTVLTHMGGTDEGGKPPAAFGQLKERLDYASTGGAPLLGCEGSVIICHGRSKANAIANAIRVATDFSQSGVNDRIVEDVAKVGMLSRVADFFTKDHD